MPTHFNDKAALALPLIVLLAPCYSMPSTAPSQGNPPVPPPVVARLLQQPTGELYQERVQRFRADNAREAPGGIVFCGDSITAGLATAPAFAGEGIINRGISGDGLAGLLQRLDVSASHLKPRKLFLLIGINDIVFSDYNQDDYEQCFDYILGRLKNDCPGCGIYIQSILPVKGKYAAANSRVRAVNQILQKLAQRHRMTYLNLHDAFEDSSGEMRSELSTDGVHPNADGHRVWHEQIIRYIS